jgi:hypothetical protein
MRRVLAFAAMLALALAATTVAAAAPPATFTSKGVSAFGDWESCSTERGVTTCTFVSLFAFEGTEKSTESGTFTGTRVCLFIDTFSFRQGPGRPPPSDGDTFEEGCSTAPAGTLAVASDLSSATLQSTTVTVNELVCTEFDCTPTGSSRDVVIAAEWTATGPLSSFSGRFKFDDGTCTETFSERGESREAVATATLDGSSLGESLFATITRGTFTFKTTCPL